MYTVSPYGDGIPVFPPWRWSSIKFAPPCSGENTHFFNHFLYKISWIQRISFVNSALFRLVSYNDPFQIGAPKARWQKMPEVSGFQHAKNIRPVVAGGIGTTYLLDICLFTQPSRKNSRNAKKNLTECRPPKVFFFSIWTTPIGVVSLRFFCSKVIFTWIS